MKVATITCDQCHRREWGIASGLSAEHVGALERDKTTVSLRAAQSLFCEGSPAQTLYCVRSGMIKLFKLAARSEPLVLRFCGPGHVLGLRSALAGRAYEDSAEAVEESVVCAIPLETFVSLLACSPGLAFSLIRKLANEALEGQERLIEFIHCGVMQRAANLLLTMREQLGGSRPGGAAPLGRLKRMDLASMIGTTPESMYRALHDLRERGVISVDRDAIRVLDSQKLRAIARVPKNP